MNRILLFSAALLILSRSSSAQFEWTSGGNQGSPLITVNTNGVVSTAPDVFFLDVSVTMQDLDLEKIQAEVAKRCGQVVKASKAFFYPRLLDRPNSR
jgi:uncharacterized protein YggE